MYRHFGKTLVICTVYFLLYAFKLWMLGIGIYVNYVVFFFLSNRYLTYSLVRTIIGEYLEGKQKRGIKNHSSPPPDM